MHLLVDIIVDVVDVLLPRIVRNVDRNKGLGELDQQGSLVDVLLTYKVLIGGVVSRVVEGRIGGRIVVDHNLVHKIVHSAIIMRDILVIVVVRDGIFILEDDVAHSLLMDV